MGLSSAPVGPAIGRQVDRQTKASCTARPAELVAGPASELFARHRRQAVQHGHSLLADGRAPRPSGLCGAQPAQKLRAPAQPVESPPSVPAEHAGACAPAGAPAAQAEAGAELPQVHSLQISSSCAQLPLSASTQGGGLRAEV